MTLLDRHGFRPDSFLRLPAAEIAGHPAVILPLAEIQAGLLVRAGGQRIGIDIANTVPAEEAAALANQVDLIAIAFPGFADGRGFTLGRRLRRAGFRGILRAVGPLIPDQFAYALACGFDEVELPDAVAARQGEAAWLADLAIYRHSYQRDYARGQNILDARREARNGGAA
jgi:uncharacterized protein (DUF934 family)